MESVVSSPGSSDVTVAPVRLDCSMRSFSSNSLIYDLRAMRRRSAEMGEEMRNMTPTRHRRSSGGISGSSTSSATPPWTFWGAVFNGAAKAMSKVKNAANRMVGRVLEPTDRGDGGRGNSSFLQVVHMDDSALPHSFNNSVTRLDVGGFREEEVVGNDVDEEENENENEDDNLPLIEVDLVSTMRAYRKNPNECFGHLVAAALSSRSLENPVTGEELKEAWLNLYLVRMLVDSRCLKIEDESVQTEIQRCVDSIIPFGAKKVSLNVYKDLPSLLRLHFVRLNPGQYAAMKNSGFEFVKLLCEYPHIIPSGRLNSILFNCGKPTWQFDIVMFVLNTAAATWVLINIVLVIVYASRAEVKNAEVMRMIYIVITYGFGYAAHLISMIFVMRAKERNVVYGEMIWPFPSPYFHVIPFLPLYDIVSLFTYIRYRMANNSEKYVAILHDIVSAQALSSLCFALCVALPQLLYLTSSIANVIGNGTVLALEHYSLTLFAVSVIVTSWFFVLRMFSLFALSDSINAFGFACFGSHREEIVQEYSAVVRMICVSFLFLIELNIYFVIISAQAVSQCRTQSLVIMSLAGVSICLLLAVFIFLLLRHKSVFRLMWVTPLVTILQVILLIYYNRISEKECVFFWRIRGGLFLFCYGIWALFFLFLFLWLIQILVVFFSKKKLGLS